MSAHDDDELLDRAIAALREETDAIDDLRAERTRRRIVADLAAEPARTATRAAPSRSGWAYAAVAAAALLLIAPTAWAATTGRLPALVETVRSWMEFGPPADAAPEETSDEPAVSRPRRRPERAQEAPRPETIEPVAIEPVALPVEEPAVELAPPTSAEPVEVAPVRAPRARAVEEPATSTDALGPRLSEAELTSYRAAHVAHFQSRDAAAAVRAWDAYLSTYPSGHFAPEARWNRALALVRAGRTADARAALAAFADAPDGALHQREARRLVDAIDARAAGSAEGVSATSDGR